MHSNSFMKSTHVPFGVCHRWPIKNLLEFVGFESAAADAWAIIVNNSGSLCENPHGVKSDFASKPKFLSKVRSNH